MSPPPGLPVALSQLTDCSWQQVAIGESHAEVYRLGQFGEPDLILKVLIRDPVNSLEGEAARLRWLKDWVPVSEVVDFVQDPTRDFLLMRALPGSDAATVTLSPQRVVDQVADALRQLHAVPIDDCPFRQSIDDCLAEAKSRLDGNLVDITDFDPDNLGRDPADLYAEMLRTRPVTAATVFTHGDYCLPNIMIADGQVSGFVDLGRAGIGDPYRDLALIGRTLDRNVGANWAGRFFARYGLPEPDLARLRYFRLLDEFF